MVIANENRYHPVRDFLNALQWDGTERIRYCLHRFLGADADDYTCEAMRLFLLGAISRAFRPGCKFEIMLCLVGGQGADVYKRQENEGVHQFQNVLFAADIRQGIVFHGFFEIDKVQTFDTVLPALQQGADLL